MKQTIRVTVGPTDYSYSGELNCGVKNKISCPKCKADIPFKGANPADCEVKRVSTQRLLNQVDDRNMHQAVLAAVNNKIASETLVATKINNGCVHCRKS